MEGDRWVIPPLAELKRYKMVVATLSTARNLLFSGLPKDHFTHIFIDEAAQVRQEALSLSLSPPPVYITSVHVHVYIIVHMHVITLYKLHLRCYRCYNCYQALWFDARFCSTWL